VLPKGEGGTEHSPQQSLYRRGGRESDGEAARREKRKTPDMGPLSAKDIHLLTTRDKYHLCPEERRLLP